MIRAVPAHAVTDFKQLAVLAEALSLGLGARHIRTSQYTKSSRVHSRLRKCRSLASELRCAIENAAVSAGFDFTDKAEEIDANAVAIIGTSNTTMTPAAFASWLRSSLLQRIIDGIGGRSPAADWAKKLDICLRNLPDDLSHAEQYDVRRRAS